jgi:tetratricopeptide (TPR) repeat protein
MLKIWISILMFSPFFGFGQTFERSKIGISANMAERVFLLESQLKKAPNDLNVLLELGDRASFNKDWDRAIDYYKKAVDFSPKNATFNFKLGGAYGMKALSVPKLQALVYISDIKTYLEEAARLDPLHIEARRALVEVYMQLPGILGGSKSLADKYAMQLKNVSTLDYLLAKAFIVKQEEGLPAARNLYFQCFNLDKLKEVNRNGLNYELGKISAELQVESHYGLKLLDTYLQNYSYKDIYSLEWVYLRKAQIYRNLEQPNEAKQFIEKSLTLRANFKEAIEEKERIEGL